MDRSGKSNRPGHVCALRRAHLRRTVTAVNPDKLFDYLDGRLPEPERRELEERLMDDPHLRRELEVARRIHAGMEAKRSDRAEVFGELSEETAARGRRLTRQIALAFGVLVAMNVLLGLLYIAHHESKNPNRTALEIQARDQLRRALDKTAATSLTPAPMGIGELSLFAENGRADGVANEIIRLAARLNGTGTKGVPDNGRIEVLAELPGDRVAEFKSALAIIGGVKSVGPSQGISGDAGPDQKISLLVQISQAK